MADEAVFETPDRTLLAPVWSAEIILLRPEATDEGALPPARVVESESVSCESVVCELDAA